MDDGRRYGMPGYGPGTYGDAFADVYDRWYASLGDDDFVSALVRHLPDHPARILELGTGTGRLLVRLLGDRSGDVLVGVDSSAEMLARARERLGGSAAFHECDFSVEIPDGPFDAVFVGWNTLFNLPDDSALDSCLGLVADRLAPGGFLLVDAAVPDGAASEQVGVRSMTAESVVLSVSRHDPGTRRITGQFVEFVDGGTVRLRPWSIRYWSPDEVDERARRVGLTPESRWSDGHGGEFTPDSGRFVALFRR